MRKRALLTALGVLTILAAVALYAGRAVRANRSERVRSLPGDEFISDPVGSVTHAITIQRSPHDVWPWLAQMGAGRAGWYAYDFIDNGRHPSAERILPEFQNIVLGTVFPAVPGVKDVFVVVRCEPEHNLVLSWRSPSGSYLTTWAFVLEEPQPGRTRLLVRGRAGPDYRPYGLPLWLTKWAAPLAHFVMERKQLLGIARRAERRVEARLHR
jgi:hypothetical protein